MRLGFSYPLPSSRYLKGESNTQSSITITPSGRTWASQNTLCPSSPSLERPPGPARRRWDLCWYIAGRVCVWNDLLLFNTYHNLMVYVLLTWCVCLSQRRCGKDRNLHCDRQHAAADPGSRDSERSWLPETCPHTEEFPGSDRGKRVIKLWEFTFPFVGGKKFKHSISMFKLKCNINLNICKEGNSG